MRRCRGGGSRAALSCVCVVCVLGQEEHQFHTRQFDRGHLADDLQSTGAVRTELDADRNG